MVAKWSFQKHRHRSCRHDTVEIFCYYFGKQKEYLPQTSFVTIVKFVFSNSTNIIHTLRLYMTIIYIFCNDLI